MIEADFSGGDLSCDGGLLLLHRVDAHLGSSRAAAAAIPDPRDPARIQHPLRDLLAQRAPVWAVLRRRVPERPQGAARRCAHADRCRTRSGAGFGAHLQPPGEPCHARAGLVAARGPGRAGHRQPRQAAG
ncbi:MAG: transposase [Betaproteobacteria bacterium]|nr:transposase [Betaproteobacteria bacterium]